MLKAESVVALCLMGLAAYFMWHATVLPIGWVRGSGPGGGAFPFWLSVIMFLAAAATLWKSVARNRDRTEPFFEPDMLRPVLAVTIALVVTIALIGWLGAYIAIALFMVWYLAIFGRHGWVLTATLTVGTLLTLFFFFEVTLKILLPKGVTEPLFFPLYAMFF